MNMPDVSLTPGRYTKGGFESREYRRIVPSPAEDCLIEVSADGTTVDLNGSVLDGEKSVKAGIYVHDCEGVTIKQGTVRGFYYGIRAVNVSRLTIENCVVSDNHNPRDAGWLPDADEPMEEGFGGGVYLLRVSDSLIEGNRFNNNFNGVSLVQSERNRIIRNNASYSGNIGVHLLGSSHNTIEENVADHCIRYTDRFWCDTADSAGILLEEYSHHNNVVGNSLRYSGDGFFIRANNRHGCNHNYVARNDASFSPNNAFEAGFSQHNVFEDNTADYSNYGFWLGYSSNTVVRGNQIRSNRLDGIAIECGHQNCIEENRIVGNRAGIRLWCSGSPSKKKEVGSPGSGDKISKNRISGSRECGVLVSENHDVLLEENIYQDNRHDYLRKPEAELGPGGST